MDWQPQRDLEIVAGTPPGGGLDRTARVVVQVVKAHGLVDVSIRVTNVPGEGARRAWALMDTRADDPHVVSVSHGNITTDHLLGVSAFGQHSFTPIAMLYGEHIAFVASAGSSYGTAGKLLEALKRDARGVTFALSTSLGNPNHIALAKVVRHAGADPRAPLIRVFDSALDAVDDVVAGHADIAAVTAASVLKALAAGSVRVLAVSAPKRLGGPLSDVPTWIEHSVDCVIAAWRGISAARGIEASHVAFWQRVLRKVVQAPQWVRVLEQHAWSAAHVDGPAFDAFLEEERNDMAKVLAELGLVR